MSDHLPELLTAKQLSEIIGISVDTLANDRYLRQGLPYIKIGKRVRYRLDDVMAYIESKTVRSDA